MTGFSSSMVEAALENEESRNQCHTHKDTAGPRLNIKTVLSTYGDFHVKDKTAIRMSYL